MRRLLYGASLFALALGGCAGMDRTEAAVEANQQTIRENEYRISSLEDSIAALNTQVAQLNNRVYEVRTRNGQKTSMTVVPINQPQANNAPPATPVSIPAPARPAAAAPQGRVIDPSAPPSPMPAASARVARPAPAKPAPAPAPAAPAVPAAELQAAAVQDSELALPPDTLPAVPPVPPVPPTTLAGHDISAPANNATINTTDETVTPVPLIPASDLALPPEHPSLPPMDVSSAAPTPAPQPAAPAQATQPAPAPAPLAATTASETAEYNKALSAARSGRTEEGIRLFQEFLQKYPSGRYAANADYWIGECLYAQGKYQDALARFNAVNATFPTHHKNADALLKAGLTLSRLGDSAGAREKYRAVLVSFPNSEAAGRVRAMGISR